MEAARRFYGSEEEYALLLRLRLKSASSGIAPVEGWTPSARPVSGWTAPGRGTARVVQELAP
jgi:hypothetical protein